MRQPQRMARVARMCCIVIAKQSACGNLRKLKRIGIGVSYFGEFIDNRHELLRAQIRERFSYSLLSPASLIETDREDVPENNPII